MFEERVNYQSIDYSSLVNLELKEWNLLNSSLKQHGLQSISFLSPSSLNKPREHWMLLDAENSQSVRLVIGVLMRDADRRQELVQDMISTNAHLREELSSQTKKTKELHTKLGVQSRGGAETQTKKANSKKLNEVTGILGEVKGQLEGVRGELKGKDEEVEALRKKVHYLIEEESMRCKRGEEVMAKLKKKPASERFDDNIISLIDLYERQLMELRKEHMDPLLKAFSPPQPTTHFKNVLKSLERNVADGLKKNKEMKAKCQKLECDLQIKETQLKARKVERVYIRDNKSNNNALKRVESVDSMVSSSLSLQHRSTRLVHLRQLPASLCHQYLEAVCSRLGVCDLEDIKPSIDKLTRHSTTFSQLEMFLRDMHQVVTRYNLPSPPNKDCPCEQGQACADRNCILETLDFWVKQMRPLKDLQQSLTNLSEKLFPWRPTRLDPKNCCTRDLVDMVDAMVLEGCRGDAGCKHSDVETSGKEGLVRVVKHFQQLFDVSQMSGVYAKMSYLYRRLNEDRNFITNVKAALKLDKSTSPLEVVEALSRLEVNQGSTITSLQPSNHSFPTAQLRDSSEIQRLQASLQAQEDFCSAFHRSMQQLICILEVDSVGQVVPTVKVLCNQLKHLRSHPHSPTSLPSQPLRSPQPSNPPSFSNFSLSRQSRPDDDDVLSDDGDDDE